MACLRRSDKGKGQVGLVKPVTREHPILLVFLGDVEVEERTRPKLDDLYNNSLRLLLSPSLVGHKFDMSASTAYKKKLVPFYRLNVVPARRHRLTNQ
jgi:hypothetical protein